MSTPRERAAAGLRPGDTFHATRTLTREDIAHFAASSGDYNPVHFDPRFAHARGFTGPICHGLLTASLVTEIGGQIGWLASGMSFRFRAPVYPGDTVTCTFRITRVDERGRARAEAEITNQSGATVIEAEITGIVPGAVEREILRRVPAGGGPANGAAPPERA